MKIAYLVIWCNEPPSGGFRIVCEHANRLRKRGYSLEVWTLDKVVHPPFDLDVPIISLRYDFDLENQQLIKIYRDNITIPDVLIVTTYSLAFACRDFPQAKCFWYLQHDDCFMLPPASKPSITCAAALALPSLGFLCNSFWVQERLATRYGIHAVRIPCGVNRKLFHPSPPASKPGRLSLVAVLGGHDWKGAEDLYEAVLLVKQKVSDLELMAISASMQGIIALPPSLTADLRLFINPPQDMLRYIYSSADVFVSPSWYEGFGLPGLEAMACGVTVVTTDSGGVREYAIPEETAIVVPPKNPEALAEGILRVLNDEKLRQKLIKNGLEKVKEFDWEKSIDKLEEVFRS